MHAGQAARPARLATRMQAEAGLGPFSALRDFVKLEAARPVEMDQAATQMLTLSCF